MTWILITLAIAAAITAAAWLLQSAHVRRRQRAFSQVLDAADALEARLRTARAEIEAVAGSHRNPVHEAMQEMLRQRLWLQEHGRQASPRQLAQVRDSIDAARRRIEQQLALVERARTITTA